MKQEDFLEIRDTIEKSEFSAGQLETLKASIEESRESMTIEQYAGLLDAINKAEQNYRPFVVANGDTLAVAGDANDTKVNRYDYDIEFRRPKYEDGILVGEDVEVKIYRNIFITPRKQTRVTKLITLMMPFFRKDPPEGEEATPENTRFTLFEIAEMLVSLDESIYDIMYDLVAYILDIPEEDKEYMTLASVIKTTMAFMFDNPESVNEANAFFE